MKELKKLPNQITLIRLILVPLLWIFALYQQYVIFGILFGIAGITDFLDGFIARKLKQISKFGSTFDTLADYILGLSAIIWIWLLFPEFISEYLWIVGLLFLAIIIDLILGFVKYGKMPDYHLYSGKLAAPIGYVFLIHASLFEPNAIFFYITALVLGICILEEILMTIKHKKMEPNKVSIFS